MTAQYGRAGMKEPKSERPIRPAVQALLTRRLRKFLGLLPRVLSEGDPGSIHDIRVASRRLQQIIAVANPRPRLAEARAAGRAVARARRALREWRDCDVLLQMLRLKQGRLREGDERRGWQMVADSVARQRERAIRRGRRKLANRRLFVLGHDVQSLMARSAPNRETDGNPATGEMERTVASLVRNAYARWEAALDQALNSVDEAHMHALRIATKRIRYRVELARDLMGVRQSGPVLQWLKALQTRLGSLQDRANLAQTVARVLTDRELLLREPAAASILLRRMAAARDADAATARRILAAASSGHEQIGSWISAYCADEDHGQSDARTEIESAVPDSDASPSKMH